MAEVRLLIVEDDEGETDAWKRSIESQNAQSEAIEFLPVYARDATEAMIAIKAQDFDAAVIDIRLSSEKASQDDSGNLVLERILDAEMAVVAAYSGEVDRVVVPESAKHVVKFKKGSGNQEVIDWLLSQVDMISFIRHSQATIKREMSRVFVQSIWPRWQNWVVSSAAYPRPELRVALTRHIASHVLASLLAASHQKAHAEEWYFIPPVGNEPMTGDLIEDDGIVTVVVTPRCDIANGKYTALQVATCEPCTEAWQAAMEQKGKGRAGKLSELLQHNKRFSEHFLPPMRLTSGGQKGPYLVNFSTVRSIPRAESDHLKSKRIASLTPEFLPSLVERLGAYFSRIGTPDYLYIEAEGDGAKARD